jgi:capsid protein
MWCPSASKPAEFVLHWFKMRRPGQHRGVPECASTLNLGAMARLYRQANLATAQKVALFTLFLKTMYQPDELDGVDPMSTLETTNGMMTALPNSVEPVQLRAEHPPANYEMFQKALINEQARPKSMPYNVAACDSSSYNYASGRLDQQTYYSTLDVDREDGNDLVLDPLFGLWFRLAVFTFGWLGGNPDALGPQASAHAWDWPRHAKADIVAEAQAADTRLKNGSLSLTRHYSEMGEDFEDEIATFVTESGMDETAVREALWLARFNAQGQQASMAQVAAQTDSAQQSAQPQGSNANANQ